MVTSASSLQFTIIGVAVMAVVAGVLWFGTGPDAPPDQRPDMPVAGIEDGLITVHVAGAVVRPGLVEVASDARVADVVAAARGATWDADLTAVNLASRVRDGERIVVPVRGGSSASAPGSLEDGIDLNTASEEDLTGLPGVGPVLAGRIVDHRDAHGPFQAVEDLLDVSGIGEAKLATLRDFIGAP